MMYQRCLPPLGPPVFLAELGVDGTDAFRNRLVQGVRAVLPPVLVSHHPFAPSLFSSRLEETHPQSSET